MIDIVPIKKFNWKINNRQKKGKLIFKDGRLRKDGYAVVIHHGRGYDDIELFDTFDDATGLILDYLKSKV